MGMADYNIPSKETTDNNRAWRTGGLRYILALLVKDWGKDKVVEELNRVEEENPFNFV